MTAKPKRATSARKPRVRRGREAGLPGEGAGRIDVVGRTGVYPVSHMEGASPEAPVRGQMEWGQGERGAAGYENHGESEAIPLSPTGEPPYPEWQALRQNDKEGT